MSTTNCAAGTRFSRTPSAGVSYFDERIPKERGSPGSGNASHCIIIVSLSPVPFSRGAPVGP